MAKWGKNEANKNSNSKNNFDIWYLTWSYK